MAPDGGGGSQAELIRAGRTFSGFTLLSRVLGLLRDMVTASILGAGWVADAFNLAWMVPNLCRRLLGEGALSSAFIPHFSRTLDRGGAGAGRKFLATVLGTHTLVLALLALLGLALVLALPVSWWGSLYRKPQVAGQAFGELLRLQLSLLLPYLVPVCLLALLGGALQARGRFAAAAAAPAVLNLFWIGGLLGGAALSLDLPGLSLFLAAMVLAGGAAQVALQLPSLARSGLLVRPRLALKAPEVRLVARDMVPVVAGQAAFQVNTFLDQVIAAAMVPQEGANTWFMMANRLFQFPLALVGTSLAVASLPGMARCAAREDRAGLAGLMDVAARTGLFLSLPAAAALAVLAGPLVALFFGRGRFGPEDVAGTAAVLAWLAAGLPFVCLVQVATRLHQAVGDLKTPVRIGTALVGLNLALNLVLVGPMGVPGLALATSFTSALNAFLLLRRVGRLGLLPPGRSLARALGRMLCWTAAMTLALWALLAGGGALGLGPAAQAALAVPVGLGAYLGLARRAGAPEWAALLGRRRPGGEGKGT